MFLVAFVDLVFQITRTCVRGREDASLPQNVNAPVQSGKQIKGFDGYGI